MTFPDMSEQRTITLSVVTTRQHSGAWAVLLQQLPIECDIPCMEFHVSDEDGTILSATKPR